MTEPTESPWFSNRGQIIQAVLALSANVLALINAWPSIEAAKLVTVGPILFYVVTILTVVFIVRLMTTDRSPKPPLIPAAKSVPSTSEAPKKHDPFFSANALVTKFTCRVGDLWEDTVKDSQRKIIVVEISNLDFVNKFGGVESSLGAVLQVNFGGMVFGGGPGTKEIGVNRFFLPVADNPYQTACSCIYNFSFTDKHVSFYAVRLDHANPQANEAIVSVCQVNGIIYD